MADNYHSQGNLLQVLKISAFRNLWLAQAVSQIAYNMLVFVLGVMIYETTHTNAKVSLLYLTIGLPAVVFGSLSGVYVDKYNKRMVLIFSTWVRLLLILLIILFRTNLTVVYISIALISVASQFFVPAEASLIPRLVGQDKLLSANSLFTLTFYSAIIGGFVAGGPLLRFFGPGILWLIAGLYILTLIILYLLPHAIDSETIQKEFLLTHIKKDIYEVINFIKNTPLVQQAIFLMTMAQAIISVFLTLGPGFADKIMHIKTTDASVVILGPAAVGMVLGAFLVGSMGFHFRKRKLIHWGILLSGFILIVLSVVARSRRYDSIADILQEVFSITWETGIFLITLLCFFILGFANSLIDISCNTVLQEKTTNQNRGKIYGILSSLISGVAILPVVISGFLADFLGIGKIILILGITLTGFGLFAGSITTQIVRENSD